MLDVQVRPQAALVELQTQEKEGGVVPHAVPAVVRVRASKNRQDQRMSILEVAILHCTLHHHAWTSRP